jgi:hypothetical protein
MSNTTLTIPVEYVCTTAYVNTNPKEEREFWMQRRDALLREVEAIERALEIHPRTALLRRRVKAIDRK